MGAGIAHFVRRQGYGLGGPGFESWQGQVIFLCSETSRPALRPLILLIWGVRALFSEVIRSVDLPSHLVPRSRTSGSLPLLPVCAFMPWTGTTLPVLFTHASSVRCVKCSAFVLTFVLRRCESLTVFFNFCCEVWFQWLIPFSKHAIQILWYDYSTLLWISVTALNRLQAASVLSPSVEAFQILVRLCVMFGSLHRGVHKVGCENHLLTTSCLVNCPRSTTRLPLDGFFIKFHIWEFCQNLSTHLGFG